MKALTALVGALALAVVAGAPGAQAFGLAETAAATGIATGLAGSSTSAVASTIGGVRSNLQGSVARRDGALRQALGGGGRGAAGAGGWYAYRAAQPGQAQAWVTVSGGAGTKAGWAVAGQGWADAQQSWAGAGDAWARGGVVNR
jgi:hypothetical protein